MPPPRLSAAPGIDKPIAKHLPALTTTSTSFSHRSHPWQWPANARQQTNTDAARPRAHHAAPYFARANTNTLSQRLHPWEWPSAEHKKATTTTDASMGRSGYDTTNMKVAKNPRPAATNPPNDADKKQPQPQPAQKKKSTATDQGTQPLHPHAFPPPARGTSKNDSVSRHRIPGICDPAAARAAAAWHHAGSEAGRPGMDLLAVI